MSTCGFALHHRPLQVVNLNKRIIAGTGTRQTHQKINDQDKPNSPYSATSFDRDTRTLSSRLDLPIRHLSGRPRDKVFHQQFPFPAEPILLILQTVRRRYRRAVNYRAHLLVSSSARYDKTMYSYIFNVVKKGKTQTKAHFKTRAVVSL